MTEVRSPLRVGVVGVGMMGTDHAVRLADRVAGACLVGLADPDLTTAEELASRLTPVVGERPTVHPDPMTLIADPGVDALVLASPGSVHFEQLLACLERGKPVLCEKPLTMDGASSLQVLDAERDAGRPLIQVGFMRRFDPEYVELEQLVDRGALGRPLLLHQTHRNRTAPNADFRSEMIVRDSLVHEVDCARFLLDDEVAMIQVLSPRPTSHAADGVLDPQVAIFQMAGGAVVTNEVFINSQTGYEVRCELVAERGSAIAGRPWGGLYTTGVAPGHGPGTGSVAGTWGGTVPTDYRARFAQAYDREVQAWADATRAGTVVGARAWDGYASTVTAEAGLESLRTGEPVEVVLDERHRPGD